VAFFEIIHSLGLLALLVVGYTVLIEHFSIEQSLWTKAVAGILFGCGAIFAMTSPFEFVDGQLYDARNPPLLLSTFFAGPIGAVVTGTMVSAFRLYLGGNGAVLGVVGIWSLIAGGLVVWWLARRAVLRGRLQGIVVLALTAPVTIYLSMLYVAPTLRQEMMESIYLPLVVISAGGTLLLGGALEIPIRRTQRFREIDAERTAAAQASDAKSRFVATMSHEIRTPLNGLLGMLALLRQENLTPVGRERLDLATRSGDSLLVLINQVLDFSKIESDDFKIRHEPFDLHDSVDHVVRLLEREAYAKGLALKTVLPAEAPLPVEGDRTRLQQVLFNLLGNAVKFTRTGSVSLQVHLAKNRETGTGRFTFEIIDTGPGISRAFIDRIFREFTQEDDSDRRAAGGAGLGLAISHRLVARMGGQLAVDTEPGKGSRFHFALSMPVLDPPPQAIRSEDEAAAPASYRVLVAEDNAINQILVKEMLETMGHTVMTAGDGVEAVEAVDAFRPDLVLMDIQMPRMDGIEATGLIRARSDSLARVPIIALTANAFTDQRERYLAAGMVDCVIKPVDWDHLATAMDRAVRWAVRARQGGTAADHPAAALADGSPIDPTPLRRMRASIGESRAVELLWRSLDDARALVRRIEDQTEAAEPLSEIAATAHELKGMAGNMGLRKLAGAAAEIHARAEAERGIEDRMIVRLRAVMEETAAALDALADATAPIR